MSDNALIASAPAAAPAPPPLAAFDPAAIAALKPEARAAFAANLRSSGHDHAAVDAAFGPPPVAEPDLRTHAQKVLDTAYPAGDADEIARGLDVKILADHPSEDVAAFASNLSTGLTELGLPSALSAAIGSEMIANAHRSQDMEEHLLTAHWSQQREVIERIAARQGMDWTAVSANVKAALDKINPEMRGEIIRSGALNSASVVVQLAMAGARAAARAAMK